MIGENAEGGGACEEQLIKLGVDQDLAALNAGLRDRLCDGDEREVKYRG